MTKDEALRMALDALEHEAEIGNDDAYRKERDAIRKALAQPEQEPVALETVYETIIQWDEGGGKRSRRELARRIVALYTTLPQRKPLTEKRIEELYSFWVVDCQDIVGFARAVERTVKGEV